MFFFLRRLRSVAFFDKDYTTPYDPAIYITGDVAFVEHRLIDTDTFKMRIVHAWVSGSRDSNYTDLSQNLTATMERRQGAASCVWSKLCVEQ